MEQILYVEAQKKSLLLFKSQFSDKYVIHEAKDVKKAGKILSKNNVDLVIIGLDIHQLATYELAQKIESMSAKPILILLTSCDDVNVLRDFINKLDFFAVIHKPYFFNNLEIVIANGLQMYRLKLENKQKQKLLQQNKMQGDILDALAAGIYLANAEFEIIFANTTIKKIIGHDIEGQKCYRAIYDSDKICLHCPLLDFSSGTKQFKEEIVYKGNIYLKHYINFNKNSRLIVCQNITEQKKNEEKVKQLLETQNSIMTASPTAIIFLRDQKVILVNEKAVDLLGYSRENIIGSTVERYYKSREEYKEILSNVYLTFNKGRIYRERLEMKHKDGSLFWAEIIGKAINEDDLTQGTIWLINDITSSILSEQKLKESEDKFHSIFANSSDAIILTEYTEQGAGKIVDINAISCLRLGYTRDKLLEMTLKDITLPELFPIVKEQILEIAKNKKVLIDSVHVTQSGERLSVEINISLIELKGKEMLLLIVRDISKRKKVLERLNSKTEELKIFNDAMVHREMRVVELKKEVNRLSQELGRKIIYSEFWKEGENE